MDKSSTIVALATSVGLSALAVIRISGPRVREIIKDVFGRDKPTPRRSNLGSYKLSNGKEFDECIWVYYVAPFSYTGEDSLEISCHGNPFIFKTIIDDLLKRGCVTAKPGEFTRRSFLNGKMELTQAEAVSAIISAKSERAFNAAKRLLSGELGNRILNWNEELLSLIAEIEVQIDFSEEEIPNLEYESIRSKIDNLIDQLRKTYCSARYSDKVSNGVNVAIVGAPNAGKSSLFNAIVGSDRAIVSDESGTTRDFITESILIDNHCINIIDTAGIKNNTDSKVEQEGINRTLKCIQEADFLIFVVDVSVPPPNFECFNGEDIKEKLIIVFSKSDLPSAFDKAMFMKDVGKTTISLKQNGESVLNLKNRLIEILEKKDIVPSDDFLIVSKHHAEILIGVEKDLHDVVGDLGKVSIEFISSKLRRVAESLSEILGNFDNEKVLDEIFSNFCIGK